MSKISATISTNVFIIIKTCSASGGSAPRPPNYLPRLCNFSPDRRGLEETLFIGRMWRPIPLLNTLLQAIVFFIHQVADYAAESTMVTRSYPNCKCLRLENQLHCQTLDRYRTIYWYIDLQQSHRNGYCNTHPIIRSCYNVWYPLLCQPFWFNSSSRRFYL